MIDKSPLVASAGGFSYFKYSDLAIQTILSIPNIFLNPEPNWSKNSYWLPAIIFGKSWNFKILPFVDCN